MSGGYWNYDNENLSCSVLGVTIPKRWASWFEDERKEALLLNRLGDVELTDLLIDVFALLVAHDFWKSCDIGEDGYQKEVQYFKKKWLRSTNADAQERLKGYVDIVTGNMKAELMKMIEVI